MFEVRGGARLALETHQIAFVQSYCGLKHLYCHEHIKIFVYSLIYSAHGPGAEFLEHFVMRNAFNHVIRLRVASTGSSPDTNWN